MAANKHCDECLGCYGYHYPTCLRRDPDEGDDMRNLDSIKLKATNSRGERTLSINRQEEDGGPVFFFTLHGRHEGKYVQIDFDRLTLTQFLEHKAAVDLLAGGN